MLNKVYAEAYAVLQAIDKSFSDKLPTDFLEKIKTEKSEDVIYIDKEKPLEEQGLSKDTLALFAYIKLNYWCESEVEKQVILGMLQENEEELEKQLSEMKSTMGLLKMLRDNK